MLRCTLAVSLLIIFLVLPYSTAGKRCRDFSIFNHDMKCHTSFSTWKRMKLGELDDGGEGNLEDPFYSEKEDTLKRLVRMLQKKNNSVQTPDLDAVLRTDTYGDEEARLQQVLEKARFQLELAVVKEILDDLESLGNE